MIWNIEEHRKTLYSAVPVKELETEQPHQLLMVCTKGITSELIIKQHCGVDHHQSS